MRREFSRAARIILLAVAALVGFSRLYLGVHTPQDVLVGIAASLLVMALTAKLMKWVAAHPGKDWIVVCAGIGLTAALALYAALKSYPADYDEAGKLIVDGAKMANDTFKAVGWISAFLTGWILERRFVGFSTEVPLAKKLARGVIGMLLFYAVSLIVMPWIKTWLSGPAATIITCFIQMFYITFLFPWCAKRLEKDE
jgi:membrane-associated phospholipid phosphatase